MKIAIAQLNYTVGDIDGNTAKIAAASITETAIIVAVRLLVCFRSR